MKKMLVLIGMLACVSIFASGYGPSGTIFTEAVTISSSEGMDPEEGLLPETNPIPVQTQSDEITSGSEPSRYAPLWGPDILVTDQCVISPRYGIALDYDANGYIYAGVQSCHTGGTDSLFIFRSMDNGYTWVSIFSSWVGSGGKLLDFDMKLEPYTTSDPEIYIIWADSQDAEGFRLYFGAVRASGTERWFGFTDPEYDSTFQVALDVEPDSNPFIVFSYIRYASTAGETEWYTCFSADTGLTWASFSHVTTTGPNEVTVSCNDSAVYYAGTIYTQSSNRFRMVRHTLGTWDFDNVSSANDTVRFTPQLATQKYHSSPSNYVYGLFTQGTDPRVYYNLSSDGGATWQTPEIWSISGDVYSRYPNMRIGWDMTSDRPVACCNVDGGSFDTLVCAMMESNFQTWYLRAAVNDYNLTGNMTSLITYGTTPPIQGRIIIYREYGENDIWFDRWDYTSHVEETPNNAPQSYGLNLFRSGDCFRINFSTPMDQKFRIEVFDILGRTVSTVADQIFAAGEHNLEWNMKNLEGETVVAGTYFVNLVTDTQKETKTVQIF